MNKLKMKAFVMGTHFEIGVKPQDMCTIVGDTMVVGKVLELIMEDGPGCGLHLNAILYYAHIPSRVCEFAQHSFDVALHSSLKRIVTTSGPKFGNWQWRLTTLPFAFGGLGVYSAGDFLNYAFFASRLQSVGLQSKLLRHTGIVSPRRIFDDALSVFNTSMDIDILEDHTFDWLMMVPISVLGQTMNGFLLGIFMETMLYRVLGLLVSNIVLTLYVIPLSTYVIILEFQLDGGLDVCVDLTRSSPLTQTRMVDFVPGRVMIDVAQHKREADVVALLRRIQKFSMAQDIGARAAVHIFNRIAAVGAAPALCGFTRGTKGVTYATPWTQNGMVDFVSGCAVVEAAQRKRVKYEAKCVDIGYGFLLFSFSSFGELDKGMVTLLKWIWKFSVTQDIVVVLAAAVVAAAVAAVTTVVWGSSEILGFKAFGCFPMN
nr:hypothetical protein [Tanacetum cinerariifolium]